MHLRLNLQYCNSGFATAKPEQCLSTMMPPACTTQLLGCCSKELVGFIGTQWNLFEYSDHHPLQHLDPSGLSHCWIKTNRPRPGYTPPVNGCSNPLTGPGAFIFTPACDTHDVCYGTCGANKSDCDERFLEDMANHCAAITAGILDYAACLIEASSFHRAVVAAGGSFFQAAQAATCDWRMEACPPPGHSGSSCSLLDCLIHDLGMPRATRRCSIGKPPSGA